MSFAQPIPYKVKYYSSKDKNAPVFIGNSGDFYTLLKACLVTGYGEKEGAGWEVLFIDDDAQKITLKRPETVGTKHVLHFRKSINNRHILAAQLEPTSIDDENYSYRISGIFDNRHPRNIPYEWHFIVCDRGFFCFFAASGGSVHQSYCIYFGDMVGPDGANFLHVGGKIENGPSWGRDSRIFSTNVGSDQYFRSLDYNFVHSAPDSDEEFLGVLLHLREFVKFYDRENRKRYTLSFPFKLLYIPDNEEENKKIAGMTVDVDGEKHLLLCHRGYNRYHSIPLEYWYF